MIEDLLSQPVFLFSSILVLLATGIIAGLLAGLLGVGGGIVIVPILFLLLPFLGVDASVLMHVAIGTSLATIIPTSIISARAHHSRGGIDLDLIKSWGPSIFWGVIVGGYIGSIVKGDVLILIFAVVSILVAINMAFRKEGMTISDTLPMGKIRYVIAFIIGSFSVIMGIGGGTLAVPILTVLNYPIKRAVGTASAIGLIIAIPGTVTFILSGIGQADLPPGNIGYINFYAFALIVPATIFMAPIGVKLAHSINSDSLRKIFSLFLFLTSMRMFYSYISG
jgi:uncharacterized membrane protein YfcA